MSNDLTLPMAPDAINFELDDRGAHPRPLDGSAPQISGKRIYEDDKGRAAGIWQCTEGKYRLERVSDEFCYILTGHWKLYGDDGSEYEVKAGDALYLKEGWKGTSHVIETVRKVFMSAT